MKKQKRILICPLDWGLGHASRCITVIRLLLLKNHKVIIAADGRPLELLRNEFPELEFVTFQGYEISYPASGSMAFKMLLSIPKILSGIKKEHSLLDKMIDEHKIDVVISDNRYGCYNAKVKSIFITHQLMIKTPAGEKALHKKALRYIANYDECWIPDIEGQENLSGDLSHKYSVPSKAFFIGNLSRFTFSSPQKSKSKYDLMAIISGPEPQRSIFEKLIIDQLKDTSLIALVVCGKTESRQKDLVENIEVVSHLNSEEMQGAILNSEIILSRPGYSTVMDLRVLGKKAIFVPTPGQTEQEYLAKLYMQRGMAFSQPQSSFDLKKAITASENYKGFNSSATGNELEKRIDLL